MSPGKKWSMRAGQGPGKRRMWIRRRTADPSGEQGIGWSKKLVLGAAVVLMVTGMVFAALGASQVRVLSITVEADKGAGEIEEPSIRISPSSCSLSEVRWGDPVEAWKPGKTVFGYLTVEGSGGFADRYTSSQCHVSGAEFRSASADKEDPSTLHVTIKYTPTVQLGETEAAGWSDHSKTRASWKKVPYATMYELRLYRDGTWIKTLETTATSLDISPYIKAEGDYTYQVRAKGKNAEERRDLLTGEYVPSDGTLFIDAADIGQVGGTWQSTNEGKRYRQENGTYPTSCWMMVMGKWYYFDGNGYAVIGWYRDVAARRWYYMDSAGVMQTGWQEIDGRWYYFSADGAMETGWVQVNPGEWYYMGADGAMVKDTVIDGQYRIGGDGRYVAGP